MYITGYLTDSSGTEVILRKNGEEHVLQSIESLYKISWEKLY